MDTSNAIKILWNKQTHGIIHICVTISRVFISISSKAHIRRSVHSIKSKYLSKKKLEQFTTGSYNVISVSSPAQIRIMSYA